MENGKLHIIATPIGNTKDITLRALEALNTVEVLICEDTRVTGKLMQKYFREGLIQNKPEFFVINDFNEKKAYEQAAQLIQSGKQVGLVSDAGTPLLSDPGFRLVRECFNLGLKVEVYPGASSVTAALSLSGLGGEKFMFVGFLPKKSGKRMTLLNNIKESMQIYQDLRIIMFLSPHRAIKEMNEMSEILGNKKAVILREITKMYEERIEGTLESIVKKYKDKKLRGELVLVIANEAE